MPSGNRIRWKIDRLRRRSAYKKASSGDGKDDYMKIHLPDFSLRQIANSGQCFRMKETSLGVWEVIALNKRLQIREEKDPSCYIFDCPRREFDEFWFDYFDLERDYGKIKAHIKATGDLYLTAAVNWGHGLRMLRQDLWETIVTFLISQQNNIPQIKNVIAKLCEPYGCQFPTANMLSKYTEDDFLTLGLGYRAKYLRNIIKAVKDGNLNLDELKIMDFCDTICFLKRFDGIGDKVANCVALFGLHQMDAFPIDTWIRRIINEQYGGNFDKFRFSGYAGIVQQYMFFYQRSLQK
jgi:N-glycosylase/DNA lyase